MAIHKQMGKHIVVYLCEGILFNPKGYYVKWKKTRHAILATKLSIVNKTPQNYEFIEKIDKWL